eukprot:scaffold459657_cov17-Prasinocladus_malaysianus.AAC.1
MEDVVKIAIGGENAGAAKRMNDYRCANDYQTIKVAVNLMPQACLRIFCRWANLFFTCVRPLVWQHKALRDIA